MPLVRSREETGPAYSAGVTNGGMTGATGAMTAKMTVVTGGMTARTGVPDPDCCGDSSTPGRAQGEWNTVS